MPTLKKTSPAPKPLSDKERREIAIVASTCAAQISAGAATTLVGNAEWAEQLANLNKALMSDIYRFISTQQ